MSFWEHLEELRGTLFRSLLVVLLFACLGLACKDWLFAVVFAPAGPDFFLYRLLGWDMSLHLINVEITAPFFVHLRTSFCAALVLAVPWLLWEIWKFIAPALYQGERRAVRGAFWLASILFYVGAAVGYCFILPVCLRFFLYYSIGDGIENLIGLGSYISMFTTMVLVVGLCFEFPSVIAVLSQLGVVTRRTLRRGRKYALLVILVLSALVTPSDPVSMLVLALPLYILYEGSILLCRPC